MRVLDMRTAVEDVATLAMRTQEARERLLDFVGQPLAGTWQPTDCPTTWDDYEGGRRLPHADCAGGYEDLPFLSERACAALADALDAAGELLPLAPPLGDPGARYMMFNCTLLSDALDEDRSNIRRLRSGGIMTIDRVVLTASRVPSSMVFRLEQDPRTLLWRDDFARLVARAKLTGFLFREAWPDASSRWLPPDLV